MPEANPEAPEPQPHNKPLLTVPEQIAHLKSKGVTFDLCTEQEAARQLREKCQFFRIYAYRNLFDKRVGGEHDGEYANLDFAHLKALSNIDRRLRDALLPMVLDVEHFAKVRLLAAAEDNGEDGYAVMRDYFRDLPDHQHTYVDSELDRRMGDPYSGAIVRKYRNDMPLWVFVEVVPFGTFLRLLQYCANRWEDSGMKDIYHQLGSTRRIRNACAHDACILNELSAQANAEKPPVSLSKALASYGFPKRLRSKWLKSPRMVQVCSLLNLYASIVPTGSTRADRAAGLESLHAALTEAEGLLTVENQAISGLLFIERLTKASGLVR